MADSESSRIGDRKAPLVKKLDAIGWGAFLIWIGSTLLVNVGWGMGLLGVGVIALGIQAARKYFGLPVERFWLMFGIVFVLWGIWELLSIQLGDAWIPVGLVPILFIAVGAILVASAFLHKSGR